VTTALDGEKETGEDNLEIRDIESLMRVLTPITADGHEAWYRGHWNSSWSLQASVHRTPGNRENEEAMLARFRQEAAALGQPYSFDDWGWITFAQHHGLPTRLLDWSQTPLVALYFACAVPADFDTNGLEPDGEFFVLNPKQLNEGAGDENGHPRLLSSSDRVLTEYVPGHAPTQELLPRAVIAPLLFDRIRFQTGTFTVMPLPEPGDLQQMRASNAVQIFFVPGDAKVLIRRQLSLLGFNDVYIYRDLDRIARRIATSNLDGT
jgi:hypothetical protein